MLCRLRACPQHFLHKLLSRRAVCVHAQVSADERRFLPEEARGGWERIYKEAKSMLNLATVEQVSDG